MLSNFIHIIVPYLVNILELMGIIVLTISAIKAFYNYIMTLFNKNVTSYKYQFSNSMATALGFKLAAEILKTVIVRTVEEVIILGAIILLRAVMSIIIHLEMKEEVNRAEKK